MKRFILGLAALAAFGTAFAAEPSSDSVPMPAANWLFVQVGDSFTSDGKTLAIEGVAPQTLMFSDRPERMTGDAPTAKFVEFWTTGKDDFQKDPPNATISTLVNGKADLVVVELLNPKLSGNTLTYDIRTLQGTVPAKGEQVSIFIDWWYGPGWRRGGWGWGPGWGRGWGPPPPPPFDGGRCWRGPYGHLHCRPAWGGY